MNGKVHPALWLLMIGLTLPASLSSCNNAPPEPAKEVLSGGGSSTRVADVAGCRIYRVFLPNDPNTYYIAAGGQGTQCGITRQ